MVQEETRMAELPSHPDTGPDSGGDVDDGPGARRRSTGAVVAIVVPVALVVLMVVLHLTGTLGPGAH